MIFLGKFISIKSPVAFGHSCPGTDTHIPAHPPSNNGKLNSVCCPRNAAHACEPVWQRHAARNKCLIGISLFTRGAGVVGETSHSAANSCCRGNEQVLKIHGDEHRKVSNFLRNTRETFLFLLIATSVSDLIENCAVGRI